jgi:SCY1-like protein 2
MNVIRKLGERVAKEHDRFLRDSQRLEDRSALNAAATASGGPVSVGGGPVDFESLVGQTAGLSVKQDSAPAPSWDDDPWGSILSAQSDVSAMMLSAWCKTDVLSQTPRVQSPAPPPMIQPTRSALAPQAGPSSVPPSPAAKSYQASPLSNGVPSTGTLGGLGLGPRSFTTPGITSTPSYQAPPLARPPVFSPPVMSTPAPSGWNDPPAAAFAPSPQPAAPNYNISLSPMAPAPAPPMMPSFGLQPMAASSGGMLAPSKPATPSWNPPKKPSEADWSSFDPLA